MEGMKYGYARVSPISSPPPCGIPGTTTFVSNDLTDFQSSLADLFVDAGVTNTLIVGRQNLIEDDGAGTVVVPMP